MTKHLQSKHIHGRCIACVTVRVDTPQAKSLCSKLGISAQSIARTNASEIVSVRDDSTTKSYSSKKIKELNER